MNQPGLDFLFDRGQVSRGPSFPKRRRGVRLQDDVVGERLRPRHHYRYDVDDARTGSTGNVFSVTPEPTRYYREYCCCPRRDL